jgi:signal transduction histidine kinase/CheY-like chemotaxis protein
MSIPPVVPTVIYVYVESLLPGLLSLAAAREARGAEGVYLQLGERDPESILAASPRGPTGMLVTSEAAAIEAISLGADKAMVMDTVDEPAWVTFVDRVRLRASIRRETERLTQDMAHAEKLTALGTLVAGVAHELNNPLSAITMGTELLREMVASITRALTDLERRSKTDAGIDPALLLRTLAALQNKANKADQLFADVSSGTGLLAQLVRDLRVFSRTTGPEQSTLIDPASLIEQSLRLVRREIIAHGVIEKDYDAALPPIVGPRNRLSQVLTNLLVNAAHAIGEVSRSVHSVRLSVRSDDGYLAISISDTGPGIPGEALEQIFNPFFTTKREGLGTGLGLSISRTTLRRLGGDLMVTSVYGEGATFICLVPLPTPEEIKAVSTWAPRLIRSESDVASMSVLIIDDDQRVVRAAARVLQGKHKVLIAHDGQEAIELLSSGSHADVVVMELDLPEVDGVEFHRWLVANQPELARRVVVATGAQERARFQAFLAGTELQVLYKPFGAETLLNAVEHSVIAGDD